MLKNLFASKKVGLNSPTLEAYPDTLDKILEQAMRKFSDSNAFICGSQKLTYGEVDTLSRRFAAAVQTRMGTKKGDRVAVMLPNMMEFPVVTFANLRAGFVQVNVNPLYTAKELRHQLKDSAAEAIVIIDAALPTLLEVVQDTFIRTIIVVGNDFDEDQLSREFGQSIVIHKYEAFIQSGEIGKFSSTQISPSDLAFLQYTGGTTGFAKGAMLSHGNVAANASQFDEVMNGYLVEGQETVITAIPMYHIFALTVNTICMFSLGSKNVLITNPRDMDAFVSQWQRHQISFATGVNTLFNGLVNHPSFREIDFKYLKCVIGGGAPVQAAVSEQWKQITGANLKEGYGLSETSPVVTLTSMTDDGFHSSIGESLPRTEISLRSEDGSLVAEGEEGELCIRGPQVMQGYWKNWDATQAAMTHDGFFKSGDVAKIGNDGRLRIVDRKKDMILVSGFNVYPNEIEATVAGMPEVLESACVGYPNEKTGEGVALFVVAKTNDLTVEDVQAFCQERLTKYKVPTQITIIDELPKSTVGKILRRELRKVPLLVTT